MTHPVRPKIQRRPKWEYRLLVGSVFFLLFALVLTIVITVVYGFGMAFPHISITAIQPNLPFPFMDAKGAIPITGTMAFSNPNAFKAKTHPTKIEIYALPDRSPASLLARAEVSGRRLLCLFFVMLVLIHGGRPSGQSSIPLLPPFHLLNPPNTALPHPQAPGMDFRARQTHLLVSNFTIDNISKAAVGRGSCVCVVIGFGSRRLSGWR